MLMETERLRLREYRPEDFDSLHAILSDPETMRHYPAPCTPEQTRRWIRWCLDSYAENGFGLWALERKDTGAFIGDCGISLQPIDGETLPEIGYHICRPLWRQGYAREAGLAVRDWGFRHLDCGALYSYMNETNLPSAATARSLGMRRLKAFIGPHGVPHEVYTITRAEWEALSSR